MLLGAEFLAMLLVVVYVGAVAVLFLFVVMMLDVDFGTLREGFVRYLPIGGVVAACAVGRDDPGGRSGRRERAQSIHGRPIAASLTNTETIGRVLYTDYIYFFQTAGLVLLVAMIGAIVLTLRHKPGVKRQDIAVQSQRTPRGGRSPRHAAQATGEGISE